MAITTLEEAYKKVLGRDPDESGKAWWEAEMAKGMTIDEVVSRLYGSPEYQARDWGEDTDKKITDLYWSVFGRDLDPGATYWKQKLAEGMPIQNIEKQLKLSPEYQAQHAADPYGLQLMQRQNQRMTQQWQARQDELSKKQLAALESLKSSMTLPKYPELPVAPDKSPVVPVPAKEARNKKLRILSGIRDEDEDERSVLGKGSPLKNVKGLTGRRRLLGS